MQINARKIPIAFHQRVRHVKGNILDILRDKVDNSNENLRDERCKIPDPHQRLKQHRVKRLVEHIDSCNNFSLVQRKKIREHDKQNSQHKNRDICRQKLDKRVDVNHKHVQ